MASIKFNSIHGVNLPINQTNKAKPTPSASSEVQQKTNLEQLSGFVQLTISANNTSRTELISQQIENNNYEVNYDQLAEFLLLDDLYEK